MAEERDFNELLDDIVLSEEREHKESYDQGFKAGIEAGNPEGYHLGYHRGAELGRELGKYTCNLIFRTKTQGSVHKINNLFSRLLSRHRHILH